MSPATLSANPRYQLLSEQILAARGEDIAIDIAGPERLRDHRGLDRARGRLHQHPAPRAGQPGPVRRPTGTPPRRSPASSSRVGANSPFLLGKELWRETRIPLFEQATDTRSEELKAQGVRPRVWFGERWITSVFDLFEENVRYFPALLPDHRRRGPARGARGRRHARSSPSCGCTTARSTAGTGRSTTSPTACRTCGWRTGCCPPGRPSSTPWPTPRSTSGWSARWPRASGRCGRRCRSAPPRRTSTPPPSTASTRRSTGPGVGQVPRHRAGAAPAAAAGPRRASTPGASPAEERDRLLGIIEQRCLTGQQRRRVVRRPDAPQRGDDGPATTRCARRCWSTASACTPTSRCTPGTERRLSGPAAGAQRRGRRPLRGSRQPCRVTTTNGQRAPGLGVRRAAAREPRQVDVLQVEVAGPGQPRQGAGRGAARRAAARATTSARSAWSTAGVRRRDASTTSARRRAADVQDRAGRRGGRSVAACSSTSAAQQRQRRRRDSGSSSAGTASTWRHPATMPRVGGRAAAVHRLPRADGDCATVPNRPSRSGPMPRGSADGDHRRGLRAQARGRGRAARAIEEAKLRGDKLVVVNSHRGGREFDDDDGRQGRRARWRRSSSALEEAGVEYDLRQLVRGFEPAEDLISIAEAKAPS